MKKCEFPGGLIYRPDGENELDPCQYAVVQKYRNVTVEIIKCKKCGHTEISWTRQENTEDIKDEDYT